MERRHLHHRAPLLFCLCRAVEIDEAGFEIELHPMHLNNRGRTGRGRDQKHVHEPDVVAQLAEQPAPFLKAHRPPHGFLLVNLRQYERRDEGMLPFLPRHADRSATRGDDVVEGLGGETPLKQNGLKRFCSVKELVAKERKASDRLGIAGLDASDRVAPHLAAVGLGDVGPGWGTDRRLVEPPWYAARS